MKKVLLIGRFSEMGGARTFYNNLAEYMINRNFQMQILFMNDVISEEQKNLLENNGISYRIYRAPELSFLQNRFIENIYIIFYSILLRVRYNVKKVIFTNWTFNLDYLTLLLIILRINVVMFVHTTAVSPKRFKSISVLLKKCFSNLIRGQKLVTVSKYNKKMIEDNWTADNVEVLYNFSNIEILPAQKSNKQITVLTMGHLREYKNPELWLEIANRVTDTNKSVKFIWAGEGEDLEEFRNKTKHNDNIQFVGYVSEVTKLYRDADLYLQLSKKETQGIAVLDAMKYGIPCIVSDRGGLPESVVHKHSGYVVNLNNVDVIVDLVSLLIKDDNKRKLMGNNGLALYNSRFTKQHWYEKLDEILDFKLTGKGI